MRNSIKDGRRFNFTIVENELLEEQNLNTYEKLTYIVLCKFANKDDACFPSRKKLAELVSCSVKTIDRTIKNLVKKGLIIKHERKNDKEEHTSNLYIIQGVASESRQGGGDSQSPPGDSESPELDSLNKIKTEEEERAHTREEIPLKIQLKFNQIFNRKLSVEFYQEITKIYSKFKIIMKALSICEKQADKPKYLLIILKDWKENNLTSVTEIDTYLENRQAVHDSKKSTAATKEESPEEELQRLYEAGYR